MASETILIVDAGEDIDQRMTTTLEAESYLVYTVLSQDVNAEMAELLKPSLIYIRPLELSPSGLKSCKTIHDLPLLKKIPIIILSSPEKALAPNYFKDYGIVDFLEPTFSPEDLIEKTRTILDKTPPSRHPKEKEDESAPPPQTVKRMEKKRPAFLRPAIGIVILLVIAGGGFLAYQRFMSTPEVPPAPAVKAPSRVPSAILEARSKSQLPPTKSAAERPAPSSTLQSAPSEAGSKSQLPPTKSAAERPALPSTLPSAPSEARSKPQLPPAKGAAERPAPSSTLPSAPSEAGSKSQLPLPKSAAERPVLSSTLPSAPSEAGSKSQLPPTKSAAERPAPPSPVPSVPPEARSKPQLPPTKSVAERPAPSSPVASAPSEAGSKSQLPPTKSAAERPAPPLPVASAPSEAGSKSQLPPPKSDAAASAPASSLPPTPPGQPSSLSSGPVSQPPRKPFYSVQLGAFKNEDHAQALRSKFREKGYDAFTQPGVTKDRSPIYRVLVNKYEDRKAAQKLAGEIQSKEGIKTTLYGE